MKTVLTKEEYEDLVRKVGEWQRVYAQFLAGIPPKRPKVCTGAFDEGERPELSRIVSLLHRATWLVRR